MQVANPSTGWIFPTVAIILLAFLASWSDLRTRRIPNLLTVSGLGLALGLTAAAGPNVFLSGLAAAGITLVLGFALFALGVLGAGDVKLFAAFAALLGLERLPAALIVCGLAGGLLVIGAAVRAGVLLPLLFNVRDMMVAVVVPGGRGANAVVRAVGVSVPYGVAISIGALGAWFL